MKIKIEERVEGGWSIIYSDKWVKKTEYIAKTKEELIYEVNRLIFDFLSVERVPEIK